MYYPGLPASYCADNLVADGLACPRLAERYNPSSRGYLVSRAAYLKRASAMTSPNLFRARKSQRAHTHPWASLSQS